MLDCVINAITTMKVKVLCRNPDNYKRETKLDLHKGNPEVNSMTYIVLISILPWDLYLWNSRKDSIFYFNLFDMSKLNKVHIIAHSPNDTFLYLNSSSFIYSSKELQSSLASFRRAQGVSESAECNQVGTGVCQTFPCIIRWPQRWGVLHVQA